MSRYEFMLITQMDMSKDEYSAYIQLLQDEITNRGGVIESVNEMGKKRLAYLIEKQDAGIYTLFNFSSEGDAVNEIERRSRLNEKVLRFLTIRMDHFDRLNSNAAKVKEEVKARLATKAEAEAAAKAASAPPEVAAKVESAPQEVAATEGVES